MKFDLGFFFFCLLMGVIGFFAVGLALATIFLK